MARKARLRTPNPGALPWRRVRQVTQVLALLVFLALLLLTRGGEYPAVPPNLFFRLDPLAWLASLVAQRAWVADLAPALLVVALTLLVGRAWCGWLCPLGTTLDLLHAPRRRLPAAAFGAADGGAAVCGAAAKAGTRENWRHVKYVLLLALLGAALAGNLSLMIFDPIALLTRGLASFGLPALNGGLMALETRLYDIPLPAVGNALDWFEASVRIPLSPANVWRAWNLLPGLLLVAVIALNLVAERFWCRYLCPLGGLLGWLSRVALVRRVVGADACRACVRCARACPTGTIDAGRQFASDPAECTLCLDCLPECRFPGGQAFTRAPTHTRAPAAPQAYDPGRRAVLGALGAGLAAALVVPLVPPELRRAPRLVRPPGAQGDDFLSKCIRCGACVKVCPTSGLQPALWESGVDGLWSPTLVPRLGACSYGCNACGGVCPTGAIPLLALAAKRETVIGKAEVDRERCLPWKYNIPCIVCEEMCPKAPKAVELDTVEGLDELGRRVVLQRPVVVPDRCIGCGICEFKCPAAGEAAIMVTGSA